MTDLTEREELLESSGYRYDFERMMYVNRAVRRAFSLEFVENNSRQEIQKLINEACARGMKRACVFVDGENFRHSLKHLFQSGRYSFGKGDYLPETDSPAV